VELANAMHRNGWFPASFIATVKGSKEQCNIPKVVAELVDPDKTYKIAGQSVTGKMLVNLAEGQALKYKKPGPVVCEGRHRIIAAFLCEAMSDKDLDVQSIEVTEEQQAKIALEGNGANDFVTRMANREKLDEVINLIKAEVYKKESDLPFKRGVNQKLWAQAELVHVHGIDIELAMQLDKEAARKAAKPEGQTVAEAVKDAIAGKAGNAKKVLSGNKIRGLYDAAKAADPEGKHTVTKLLAAIVSDVEITAKKLIAETFAK